MNALDIVISVILGFCLIRGAFRGLIKELSSIIGVLGGFYAAYTYYTKLADPISRWISNIAYVNILSFLIIFCSVFIAISILGIVIKYILNSAFLGWIDHISGAVFGGIKGILIVSIVLLVLTAFLPRNAPVIRNAILSPHVMIVSEQLAKAVPRDMRQQFSLKIEEFKKIWE